MSTAQAETISQVLAMDWEQNLFVLRIKNLFVLRIEKQNLVLYVSFITEVGKKPL